MSVSLLFCPLTLRELHLHLFSFDSVLNTRPVWCLALQHPSPWRSISERRPQNHRTARLNCWLTDASLRLSLKERKRQKSRYYHLCSSSLIPDCEPLPYTATRLLMVHLTFFISRSLLLKTGLYVAFNTHMTCVRMRVLNCFSFVRLFVTHRL